MLAGQDITILGGGIGGFAAATALARRGARVRVLEQAAEIGEVGAGLQISPNGVRVLDALGIGEAARARSVKSRGVRLIDGPSGRDVLHMDLARLRPRDDYLLFHRADLLAVLHEAAVSLGVVVETGARVSAAEIGPQATRIEIEGQGAREVDFLVGAGGLHSILRREINGPRAPFFTGQVAWRALVPAGEGEAVAPEARVHMGPGRHLVVYPLRDGRLINIVAVEERKAWADEGWHHEDAPENLARAFAGFAAPVRALLERVERVHLWGLHRHPVADQWHKGRAVILGDAAHPTLPFMAQGAVMALEDAFVLADSLAKAGLEDGPGYYQARRRHRVVNVIEAANRNARNYHHANPLARFIGHGALRLAGRIAPERVLGQFDWIYDHDVTRG